MATCSNLAKAPVGNDESQLALLLAEWPAQRRIAIVATTAI